MLFSGTDEYRLRRAVLGLERGLLSEGYDITRIEGGDHQALLQAISGSVMFENKELILLSQPDKADADTILDHFHDPQPGITVALVREGTPKKNGTFSKLVEVLPKRLHQRFALPPFFKQADDAILMCVQEAKERGKDLPGEAAEMLVNVVGSNLGMLHWEVFKLCTLLDAQGETKVTPKHVRGTVAQTDASGVQPLIDALGLASLRRVSRQLSWIERTHPGDPTMKVVRFIYPSLTKWLAVADLHERGLSPSEAASDLNLNSWYHKNKLLPVAKRWKRRRLFELMGVLRRAERGVLKGSVSPWMRLSAGLLRACREIGKR